MKSTMWQWFPPLIFHNIYVEGHLFSCRLECRAFPSHHVLLGRWCHYCSCYTRLNKRLRRECTFWKAIQTPLNPSTLSLVGASTPATTNSTNSQLLHVTTYALQRPQLPSNTTPRTPRLSDSLDSRIPRATVVAKESVRVGHPGSRSVQVVL